MHFLQNGSQVEVKPTKKNPVGPPGFFSEGGNGLSPSYPGADFFNTQVAEFQAMLIEAGIDFDPEKEDHMSRAIQRIAYKNTQFSPWDALRTYRTGEICTEIIDGQFKIMQMYAGPDMTCKGKDPADIANRHDGWQNSKAPFWWVEYKANIVGMPFFWLDVDAPEWAVMEINVDLPTLVYWRLANVYPHLVNNGIINTGEIRGEFLRVLDQGREIDNGRKINSLQPSSRHSNMSRWMANGAYGSAWADAVEGLSIQENFLIKDVTTGGRGNLMREYPTSNVHVRHFASISRNVARPMAIAI